MTNFSWPRAGRNLLAALVATLVVVAAGTLLVLTLQDRLPQPVAVHWGIDGPDRFAALGPALLGVGAIVLGSALLPAVIGVSHRRSHHLFAGLSTGVAVFAGAVGYGSLWSQRDLAEAAQAPTPGAWMALGAFLGIVTGVAVGLLLRPATPPAPAHPARLPEDAARLQVPDGTRVAWFGTASASPLVLLLVLVPVTLLIALAVVLEPWLAIIAALVVLLLWALSSGRVTIDARGVGVSSPLGIRWLRVPLERISSAGTEEVEPLRQFGGYGLRVRPDGRRGFVTRAGQALTLYRVGEPDLVITVEDADQAALAVNTLIEQRAAAT